MPLTLDASSTEFISLDEVKAQTNVKSPVHDDELDLFRGAAQEAVEGIVGPVLWRTVTEVRPGGTSIFLRHPVVSVTSVTAVRGGAVLPHTVESGSLSVAYWWGDVLVTYVAGRTVVPDSIRVAALIIAEHLWTTQRGASPAPSLQGDESVPVPGMAYSIPNRATDLLRPYLLPPAVG